MSVNSTPTVALPSPTVEAVFVTVTVTAASKPELFLNSFWGCLTAVDLLLTCASLWTALIVGFNRLSIITVIVPTAAAVGNGLLGYFIISGWPWRPTVYAFMRIGWYMEHVGAFFYSYFILQYLLSTKRSWAIFSAVFWLLLLTITWIDILNGITTGIDMREKGNVSNTIKDLEQKFRAPSFMIWAAAELWAAGFLLFTLYQGRRNAKRSTAHRPKRVNLLRQLAQSTEIRVATYAAVYIIRASAGWTGLNVSATKSSHKIDISQQIDNFAVILENMYPVLLIIDLIAARMTGSSPLRGSGTVVAHGAAHSYSGPEDSPSSNEAIQVKPSNGGKTVHVTEKRRGTTVMETVDSIRRDFGEYLGRGKAGNENVQDPHFGGGVGRVEETGDLTASGSSTAASSSAPSYGKKIMDHSVDMV